MNWPEMVSTNYSQHTETTRLDYEQLYKAIGNKKASELIRQYIKTQEAEFLNSDKFSIVRKIVNPGPETKLNGVLISVESFSADFMELFSNTEAITPFLDSLSNHSLVFTNLYATGITERTRRNCKSLIIAEM